MSAGRPAPRWGWHRLDARWADRVVADSGVGPGDLVLDVGAGDGALTLPLLAAGARVVAIEAHPGRAAELERRVAGRAVVVRADAADLRLPRRPFHVVANPPFGITTPLLRRLLQPGSRLVSAHVLLERAAAQRWASGRAPGFQRWHRQFEVGLGGSVPRRAFVPPPRVDVVTLVIRGRRPGGGG